MSDIKMKGFWAIVDEDDRVVGEWIGSGFCVRCYQYDEAKRVALYKKIPRFKLLLKQEIKRLNLEPSPFSRKIW